MEEAVARKHMDDLKEVLRGYLEDADKRLLDRLGHIAEATLVVSTFEHMNFCDWHLKVSLAGRY
jgi:transcription termination factor NusB